MRLSLQHLRGDIFGGITAAIVALPLALAFGVQSGMGAAAGLYGAIALGIVAAAFGGTPTQISGPTGPMTVISALVISQAIALTGDLESALAIILPTFFLAGALQIVFALLRLGRYIKYIPYPVVSGFMTGIGVIIICLQLFPMLGYPSPKTIPAVFANLHQPLMAIDYSAFGLATATIAIIYLFPFISRIVPSSLVALIIMTIVASFLKIDVPKIENIPTGIPELQIDTIMGIDFTHFQHILFAGLTLAALGAVDSLLTSVVADNMTKTKHKSNRELVGQGLGNMLTALIGGIPGAGATMRTVVNINAGGRTQISGVLHGVVLLVILIGAGRYAEQIPLAVLAGILITVGISIIDYRGIKHLTHVPRADAAVMLIVLAMTVFVDLLQAVLTGMVLASFLFMKKMSEAAEEGMIRGSLKDVRHNAPMIEELPWPDETIIPEAIAKNIYIKHLDGPLFFGFVSQFQDIVLNIPEVSTVIIRMMRVPYIDQSGLYAIEEAVYYLQEKNIKVYLTGLQGQPRDMMRKINLIPDLIPEDQVYPDFQSCISDLAKDS